MLILGMQEWEEGITLDVFVRIWPRKTLFRGFEENGRLISKHSHDEAIRKVLGWLHPEFIFSDALDCVGTSRAQVGKLRSRAHIVGESEGLEYLQGTVRG
jgi:hypothetical protein